MEIICRSIIDSRPGTSILAEAQNQEINVNILYEVGKR